MPSHIAQTNDESVEFVRGDGSYLFDAKSKRYVDFSAGWCVGSVGWGNKEVAQAIKTEADHGMYLSPRRIRSPEEELAKLLIDQLPNGNLSRCFRCTSGSEAVEFAIKCARAATGCTMIVSIGDVYHGHTYGAASIGNACVPKMAPCLPGFITVPMPNLYRGVSKDEVVSGFEKILDGPQGKDIAAFFSEPVWTNAGAIVPPSDFYADIEDLCREHGALFVMDEVATGCGRCGTFFASESWGLTPDIITLGKGLTGGYGSMGATITTEEVFERSKGIPMYSTFGWAAQDLAAAYAVNQIIVRDRLEDNAAKIGSLLLEQLKILLDHPHVGQVRGMGLVIGVEIVEDKESKEPDTQRASDIEKECLDQGLIIDTAGNVLFITPPLILDEKVATEGATILRDVMRG